MAIAIAIVVSLAGFFFGGVGWVGEVGWVGGVIALVVAAPLLWRLEHHCFFQRTGNAEASDRVDVNEDAIPPRH